jgi:hypothetical protein
MLIEERNEENTSISSEKSLLWITFFGGTGSDLMFNFVSGSGFFVKHKFLKLNFTFIIPRSYYTI